MYKRQQCRAPGGNKEFFHINTFKLQQSAFFIHAARVSGKAPVGSHNAVAGHNEISIIVPCHRVVGGDGNLTGYAGGIDKKIALLKMEKGYKDTFFVPKKGSAR